MSFDSFLRTAAARNAPTLKDRFVEARTHAIGPGGEVYFTVPTWDDGKHVFGPAQGQSATVGDTVLVLFLGEGVDRPWVVSS